MSAQGKMVKTNEKVFAPGFYVPDGFAFHSRCIELVCMFNFRNGFTNKALAVFSFHNTSSGPSGIVFFLN